MIKKFDKAFHSRKAAQQFCQRRGYRAHEYVLREGLRGLWFVCKPDPAE